MEYYYEVAPLSSAGTDVLLTYSAVDKLQVGCLVHIHIRSKKHPAMIIKQVEKPTFQTKPITAILDEPIIPIHVLKLAEWMSAYYLVPLPRVIRSMLPSGLGKKRRLKPAQTPKSKQRGQIALNQEQRQALNTLAADSETAWLHGTTGSGKTRIYVELADQVVQQGKDVVLLVPEISLTPQLLEQFKLLSSSENIQVAHSGLTESERHLLWREIATSKKPTIVIGARSALFMPLHNPGLIIIDEAHDSSYHQDQQPRYNTLRVASYLGSITDAKLVLGSATPPVDEMFYAQQQKRTVIRLGEPVFPRKQTSHIIDLSDKSHFSKSRWLSNTLLSSIEKNLESNTKSLLLLNLRGTRQTISCTNCGWVATCPNCLITLKYHHDLHYYRCHICDYRETAAVACPSCAQPELHYGGIGTKQLETDIKKIFPGAQVVRYDRDSIDASTSHHDMYARIIDPKTQIIIGTQLVSKGFDIDNLNTIGIIHADSGLQIPDFSSQEKTFQMIYQVAGRAGRQGQASELIVQTFMPEHPAIQYAIARDYEKYYEYEITNRLKTQLPPFTFIAKLTGQFKSQATAESKSEELASRLKNHANISILGPAPAFHEYFRGIYHWQIILKSKKRAAIIAALQDVPPSWHYHLDPNTLL